MANRLGELVKQYWGYDEFRPLQAEAMGCVVEGRDSVVVLPTGGGKSLCFQAPALALDGMGVVISPLISLMKDQVDALEGVGVPAACINSMMTAAEKRRVDEAVRERRLKLLYVSPERAVMPTFIEYLTQAGVSFLAVDEAHCISQWGHDFRPEYRGLHVLREAMPNLAVHAYTATATQHVRDDIMRELNLREPSIIVGSFDRPNLTYRVQQRGRDVMGQLREVIDRHPNEAGIVYCIRRRDVDDLCERLAELGHNALPYHAGMSDEDRKRNQEAFRRDEADIVVATVAFGMGIDKPNIRYVAHAGMPKTLEHYQQETGRAGRDGLEAECVLFYGSGDYGLWKGLADSGTGDGGAITLAKLNDMYQYCTRAACRHAALLTYFGERYSKVNCGACDTCLEEGEIAEDSGPLARRVLEAVIGIGDFAGPQYTTLVLSGTAEERVVRKGHDRLETFGALRTYPTRQIRTWIEELAAQGFLEKHGEYNLLGVTEKGRGVLDGTDTPRLSKAAEGGGPAKARAARGKAARETGDTPYDEGLFEVLRGYRKQRAQAAGVPSYVLFGDEALRDMARKRPATLTQFLNVTGVGQKKCKQYGEEFLKVIGDYCAENGLSTTISDEEATSIQTPRPVRTRMKRDVRQAQLDELFEVGRSVMDIAEELQMSPVTIGGYLADYLEKRGRTDPAPWSSEAVLERVREVVDAVGGVRLRPIFEALEGEVDYEEIRVCLACLRNGA